MQTGVSTPEYNYLRTDYGNAFRISQEGGGGVAHVKDSTWLSSSPPFTAAGGSHRVDRTRRYTDTYRLFRLPNRLSQYTKIDLVQIAAFNASAPEEIDTEHVDIDEEAPPVFTRAVHPCRGIRITDRPVPEDLVDYIDDDEEWFARIAERPHGTGAPEMPVNVGVEPRAVAGPSSASALAP